MQITSHTKYPRNILINNNYGAASVIRTRDLTLTKGALYRWSYGSIVLISRPVQIKGQDRGGVYAAIA